MRKVSLQKQDIDLPCDETAFDDFQLADLKALALVLL